MQTMPLEVEATYEGGVLKLDKPLPLDDHVRVKVTVEPHQSRIRRSAGLIPWKGETQALAHLLGPDNLPWGE
jgi:predicted DNA-binding antitoxin AbrB/MazE fold protein